jgi:Flp pilus assembly protein TadG
MRHKEHERGQVVLLLLVAMAIFVLAAIGFAIDGSNLYLQRQMAQVAADAAAQAAMMSIFDGTYNDGVVPDFPTSSFNCTAFAGSPPCVYALRNGFGATASDTTLVEFPAASEYPGISLSTADPTNLVRATVTRRVNTTLLRLLGSNFTDVAAKGTAAIVSYDVSPPILVLDPTRSGALDMHGNPTISITGGGSRSIQVNSKHTSAFSCAGNPSLDVPGLVGVWGGPTTMPCKNAITGGGAYLEPSSPVKDFLANVAAPADPGAPAFAPCKVGSGQPGCPAGVTYGCTTGTCTVYYPGHYSGITVKNQDALFRPGLYYMSSGDMAFQANSTAVMATCSGPVTPDPKTGCGMVVYFPGNGQEVSVAANAGSGAPGISLLGDTLGTFYSHILFFSRSTGSSNLGGGGAMTVTGTVYLPNQSLDLGGGSGSNTTIVGNILVNTLSLGGNASVTMTLDPTPLRIRQVALVR